jgi:hypothetical protein
LASGKQQRTKLLTPNTLQAGASCSPAPASNINDAATDWSTPWIEEVETLAPPTVADFQQAKTSPADDRFLQIKAEKDRHKLTRVAFRVSRLTEFCSIKELQNQTAHQVCDWPLVVLKELIDNALDGTEEIETAPVLEVTVRDDEITIQDNGAGIPAETIRSIQDFSVRVSTREAYVSPSRGAQGNALKTIIAMAYVLDRERRDGNNNEVASGTTIIETRGVAHRIEFQVDHVTNEPKITYTSTDSPVHVGTRIKIKWPGDLPHYGSLINRTRDAIKALVEGYVWFNPHLTIRGTWNGEEFIKVQATNQKWAKWGPRNPTSPHWYNDSRLQRYMSAHVARDRESGLDRPVREFIAEFRGLSATKKQKAILAELGASHRSLRDFFGVDKVNRAGISQLLAAMKRHSEPVKPKHLGVIGKDHLKTRFLAAGGQEETFKYERRTGVSDQGIQYVIEFAFGLHRAALEGNGITVRRKIITGANWSAAINNPFRSFGRAGEGLDNILARVRANSTQPVICALHLASAHLQFADRGKSSIITTGDVESSDV